MTTLACSHQEMGQPRRACLHLLAKRDAYYCQRFTGIGKNYDLACMTCKQQPEQIEANLRDVCQSCFASIEEEGYWEGMLGQPQVLERHTGLAFAHETVLLQESLPVRIRDIQPVDALAQSVWVALTENGALARIDLDQRSYSWLAQMPEGAVNVKQELALHVSVDGNVAAIVNTHGQHGVVIDLQTGQATMHLRRDTSHSNVSVFPIAFCEMDGRLLLIHGTAWNRLDVSDPRTGELLTRRVFPPHERGKPLPEHYLDYFHCGLAVSPSQEWIVDNGWFWQPVGLVEMWNLQRWLRENAWESEDGSSRKMLCWREGYWDGPLCWIDGQTLAVWGYGKDDEWLFPAARIFDVVSGKETRWFPGPLDEPHQGAWVPSYQDEEATYWRAGPRGFLAFDTYLFACSAARGTSVWDVATGERLLHDASLRPLRYHRGARQFLTALLDGAFQISRLIGQA